MLSSINACIDKLINEVERSAAPGLKDRAKLQGESCLDEARVALQKTVDTVKETLNNEQKEVSRSLAPHVQGQLLDGYTEAMEHRGKGSVARQKVKTTSFRRQNLTYIRRRRSIPMCLMSRTKFLKTAPT